MNRPEHQDIDGLADALGKRAELEGLHKGFRINVRRSLGRWAIRWSLGLAVAIAIGMSVDWLWWLPFGAAGVALISLGSIFVMQNAVNRRIRDTRNRLVGLEDTLASLARDSGASDR